MLVLFALSIVPMAFATGMGIDYARAMQFRSKLNAAADAAALATVSKQVMDWPADQAKQAAAQMFITQTQDLAAQGLLITYTDAAQLTITVSDTTGSSTTRKTTVSYSAKSKNLFAAILGITTLPVQGSSGSTASLAPNIDFYVMMDTSPSMLLPATAAGLSSMISATGGCAFACHETKNTNDNFKIARANNIVLRTDLVITAVEDLTSTASKMAQTNNATYRMGLQDFDYAFRSIWPTQKNSDGSSVDSNLSRVQSHVSDAVVPAYCQNNYRVCGTADDDTTTNHTVALKGISDLLPTPGNGSKGATPQEILFIITDGMRDEMTSSGSRVMGPMPTGMCDTIKGKGVRIAILNTKYLPESASDSWSITNVRDPYLSPSDKITPALSSCASPGLFYQVTTNDDLSAALSQLFQKAVATAHLIQ